MDLQGKVFKKLDEVSGTAKNGNQWRKREIVLETDGKYPKKVCFSLWGDKIDDFNFNEGDMVQAKVDLESREYNGRWYTEVKAWQVDGAGAGSSPASSAPSDDAAGMTFSADDDSDLPF